MAREIIIRPNRGTTGSTLQPTIYFSGATNGTINLKVEDDGSIVYEGNNGGLFNITDSKDGLLHSVNDVSGLPILSVYSTDKVTAGGYNLNAFTVDTDKVFVGTNTITVSAGTKFVVSGNTQLYGSLIINSLGTGTSINNLGIDSNGKVIVGTTGGSGGVSINPYYQLGTGSTFTWDVSGNSTNYQITISATTTVNLTNVRNGDYGTLIVQQDSVGSRTVTLGTVNGSSTTHRIVNGGGGSPTLTDTASAFDILSFTYNGSNMFWTVGNDYT